MEWHEWKTGVYYRHEQSAHAAGKRGVIDDKVVIGWQREPVDFARRLHWKAQCAGLGRAQAKLVVGDGAPWIWNVAEDRWARADQMQSNRAATNYGTDVRNKCWPSWPH